jgi:hypothetical protein
MKSIWNYSILILFILLSTVASGQVTIDKSSPNNGTILDIDYGKRGFLPTRLNRLQRSNMKDIAAFAPLPRGLVVYDTDDQMYYYFNPDNSTNGNENWQALSPFIFKDDQSDYYSAGDYYHRDIETHRSVKGVSLFNNTTISTARRLHIKGGVSVSSNSTSPPADYGLYVAENASSSGNIAIAGNLNAASIDGPGMVPIGAIIMWAGGTLPSGFVLCDGNNGTPNLSGKFIMSHGSTYTAGNGAALDAVKLVDSNIPEHDHSIVGTFNTNTEPDHRHIEGQNAEDGFGTGPSVGTSGDRNTGSDDVTLVRYRTSTEPDHKHSVTISGLTSNFGTTAAAIQTIDNRPVYYALAFIMRIN